jgi:hypothetical protein
VLGFKLDARAPGSPAPNGTCEVATFQ